MEDSGAAAAAASSASTSSGSSAEPTIYSGGIVGAGNASDSNVALTKAILSADAKSDKSLESRAQTRRDERHKQDDQFHGMQAHALSRIAKLEQQLEAIKNKKASSSSSSMSSSSDDEDSSDCGSSSSGKSKLPALTLHVTYAAPGDLPPSTPALPSASDGHYNCGGNCPQEMQGTSTTTTDAAATAAEESSAPLTSAIVVSGVPAQGAVTQGVKTVEAIDDPENCDSDSRDRAVIERGKQ
jgi:hypothetical protein